MGDVLFWLTVAAELLQEWQLLSRERHQLRPSGKAVPTLKRSASRRTRSQSLARVLELLQNTAIWCVACLRRGRAATVSSSQPSGGPRAMHESLPQHAAERACHAFMRRGTCQGAKCLILWRIKQPTCVSRKQEASQANLASLFPMHASLDELGPAAASGAARTLS